jgi:serine protease Do
MRRFVCTAMLGGCAFLGGLCAVLLAPHLSPQAVARVGEGTAPAGTAGAGPRWPHFEDAARRVLPAVVALDAKKPAPAGKARPVEESGSGVLVHLPRRPGTFVLTNNHVVEGAAAGRITVNLSDGRIYRPAQVWTDPESDVAVLRIDGEALPVAELGDSDTVRVGQWVLACGSPFGLHQSVTGGIISARERGQVSLGSTIRIKDFLQTDAAINPGSSGGPLIDTDGEVIGLNTAIASPSGSSSGVAFSIPIDLVLDVAGQLLESGSVARGYMGVQVAALFEPEAALRLGLKSNRGALVEKVYAGTPAAEAGLRANDVILALDGRAVRNENHFINRVSGLAPGKRVRMAIWRDGRTITLNAVVGDWGEAQRRFGFRD